MPGCQLGSEAGEPDQIQGQVPDAGESVMQT